MHIALYCVQLRRTEKRLKLLNLPREVFLKIICKLVLFLLLDWQSCVPFWILVDENEVLLNFFGSGFFGSGYWMFCPINW